MNRFTIIPGRGRFPRAVRELQEAVTRQRPGLVPGALVSATSRGTLVEPDPLVTGTARTRTPDFHNVWR